MDKPWRGSTALLVGNEGTGLTPAQRAVCDHYVYIPQYSAGTASLNVTVAGSIIMVCGGVLVLVVLLARCLCLAMPRLDVPGTA